MCVRVCACVFVHVVSTCTIVLLLDLEGGTEREGEGVWWREGAYVYECVCA